MRWPNRRPHTLTGGMRRAQKAMASFLPLVDWPRFRRRDISGGVRLADRTAAEHEGAREDS